MSIVKKLKEVLADFAKATPDSEELARLQQFLNDMKHAGVAKTREYDLPRPDTIGRAAIGARCQSHPSGRRT